MISSYKNISLIHLRSRISFFVKYYLVSTNILRQEKTEIKMYFFSTRLFLVVIVSYLFVRAAQCKETELACPIRRPLEVGKRGENSPEAVNQEYKFIVLVETTFYNRSNTWAQECVGTLVTETQVVTAGHCVQPELEYNAHSLEVNLFFLQCYNVKKSYCMKTPVGAFINYNQLSRDGEPHFDLGLLYLLHAFKPIGKRTLPLCNESESEQVSSKPLFMLSFSTDESKRDKLLLTRVPLMYVKNVHENDKWLTLKLHGKGIACSGDSGSPVILQARADHICLLAVQAKILDFWEDDGISKSHWIEASIVKEDKFITKMIQDDRKPNSVEQQEWSQRHAPIFREMSPSLGEGSLPTEPFLPDLDENPKSAGCFSALWKFCKRAT